MNKGHWSKIDINKIKSDILDTIIKRSFDITAQKNKKKPCEFTRYRWICNTKLLNSFAWHNAFCTFTIFEPNKLDNCHIYQIFSQ